MLCALCPETEAGPEEVDGGSELSMIARRMIRENGCRPAKAHQAVQMDTLGTISGKFCKGIRKLAGMLR